MEEKKKTRHRFNVRIEAWDRKGNNLGWKSHTIFQATIDDARAEGTQMYKSMFVKEIKQITIANDESKRIWKYLNGRSGFIDNRGKFVD